MVQTEIFDKIDAKLMQGRTLRIEEFLELVPQD